MVSPAEQAMTPILGINAGNVMHSTAPKYPAGKYPSRGYKLRLLGGIKAFRCGKMNFKLAIVSPVSLGNTGFKRFQIIFRHGFRRRTKL